MKPVSDGDAIGILLLYVIIACMIAGFSSVPWGWKGAFLSLAAYNLFVVAFLAGAILRDKITALFASTKLLIQAKLKTH